VRPVAVLVTSPVPVLPRRGGLRVPGGFLFGDGAHGASWVDVAVPDGTDTGVCFFDLDEDGLISEITDFWPMPYDLPASRAHLVERY